MPIYQIVISVLSQPTQSNLDKSVAAAMLDGTIRVEDLAVINGVSAFPGNHFNNLKLPEGAYSSNEAMSAFTRTIGSFLGDRNLYQITHKLIAAEIKKAGIDIFHDSSLAKCFLFYEMERHAANTNIGCLPAVTLSHLQALILPLFSQGNHADLQQTFNSFAMQKIKLSLLDQTEIHKYLIVIDYYSAASRFNAQAFNLEQLSEEPNRQPARYPEYLQQMLANYKTLGQSSLTQNGARLFAGNSKVVTPAVNQTQAGNRHYNCVIS